MSLQNNSCMGSSRKIFLIFSVFSLLSLAGLYAAPSDTSFYEHAFLSTGVPVLVIDADTGTIRSANSAAQKFYGYSKTEITGMNINQINTMPRDEIRSEMERAKNEERNYFIFRHRLSSGAIKTVEVYSWPVKDAWGKVFLFSIIHDITEKNELEIRVAESEKEHIKAEIFAGVGHWFVDMGTKTVTASEGAREIYGLFDESITLEQVRATALPEYREVLENALVSLVRDGKPYDVTFKIKRHTDGEILTVRSVAEYREETGTVFGIISNITESARANELLIKRRNSFFLLLGAILLFQAAFIVQIYLSLQKRKRAEKALAGKTAELENFFGLTIDLLCIADLNGKFVKLNRAWENTLGYRIGELEGRDFFDLIHPDDIAKTRRAVSDLAENMQVDNFVNRYKTSDGSYRLLEWRANPHGSLIYAAARDITDRNKADIEIRKREKLLGKIFEILPVGLWIADKNGKLLSGNPEGIRIWGMEKKVGPEEYGVFRARRLPSGIEIKPEEWALARTISEGATIRNELIEIDAFDKAKRTVLNFTAPVLDDEGKVESAIIVNQDISEVRKMEDERIKLERQIQQTQKLESLGILAGGIAHDFNNILMAVLGHAELALDELSPVSPARRSIKEIETASRRAAELCRQMLAYSGKATFFMEKVDLREMIEEMVHLLKTSISKKAILNLDLEKGLPPIMADASQIRQIIMNLIINASDAIDQRSGIITIALGAARCDNEYLSGTELYEKLESGLYVYIEVTDTGCGMDSETQKHIFEPFFSTKFAGRGLGLAAVLGIVRAHKGAIKVYSEVNKGTTFKVLFPAINEPENADSRASDESRNVEWKGSGVVLIADDEESLRALGTSMLEHLGFKVLSASDGKEAVETYISYPGNIDLVILDLTMPHMDGSQALSELKRINPDVKVVIASGYNKDDVGARFAGKNLCGVLQKPYSMSKLKELLSAILAGNDGKQ